MAKAKEVQESDTPPEILVTIRHGGQLFLAGNAAHAKALAEDKNLHPESIKRLLDTRAISGSVFTAKVAAAAEAQKEDEKKGKAYKDSDLPAGMPGRLVLVNNGMDTLQKVRDASDEQLMAIKGMNADTLKGIRAATA